MKVFKFGGASIKDVPAVKNLLNIVKDESSPLLVVISAMGKTTNALEELHQRAFDREDFQTELTALKKYHNDIIHGLFELSSLEKVSKYFDELEQSLNECHRYSRDFTYPQIVAFGELISTTIISEYLNVNRINNEWFDARKCIQTDNTWTEGTVNWDFTKTFARQFVKPLIENTGLVITQGFIGSSPDGNTTVLGREGSDFSAAIFGSCLQVESITVWKDVDGILTGDPKVFDETEKFEQLSYRETVEMAYYGASVIHPKTLKPLSEKKIPLYVKSFINPNQEGTVISDHGKVKTLQSYILKGNQCLITFTNRNLDFTDESGIGRVLGFFDTHNIKINLIQSAATSFSVSIDFDPVKIEKIIHELSDQFEIHYNSDLQLLTVKNYNYDIPPKIPKDLSNTYLEQKTRNNLRILFKVQN